jgi:phospholipid/cholesterol/gamma-HCH transport system substrate-binding protein
MRRGLVVALAAALALAGTACTLQTAGGPKGDLALTTVLDDAQHLVTGHSVRVADVKVGTVTKVQLEGFRARVRMSIVDGQRIPEGTTAVLAQTSLLGENYIGLRFPEQFDPENGPFLKSGAEIPTSAVEPQLEQVTDKLIEVVGALATGDLTKLVDAAATALEDRGEVFNQLISQLSRVGDVYATQSGDLGRMIDGLGKLGDTLAAGAPEIGTLIDNVATATTTLAVQRQKIVGTIERLTEMARALNDHVLEPHGERLGTLLRQVDPVLATVVREKATLEALITNVRTFVTNVEKTYLNGSLLFYVWMSTLVAPNGQHFPTEPFEQQP